MAHKHKEILNEYLAHRNRINDRILRLKEREGKTSQKVEQETSQVDNTTRVVEDKVNESAVELLKVKIDSEILANSLLKLQEKAVQTPKKVKKFKKVKLAANF